jgi:predicted permease
VKAALGRVFDDSDRVARGVPPALVSHAYWQRELGGDPAIVGREIRLNTRAWTIAGVLPAGFGGTQPLVPTAIWVPVDAAIAQGRTPGGRDSRHFATFGRLRAGASLSDANAELGILAGAIAEQHPASNAGRTFKADFEGAAKRRGMGALLALVLGVSSLPLLIACGNVTGLLFGRAEERRREMAVRLSLGASRRRLVRQLVGETAVLSLLAVGASLLLAFWIVRGLPSLIPPLPLVVNLDFRIDARSAIATTLVAVAAAMAAGIAPAFTATRVDLNSVLKAASPGTPGKRRRNPRHALVVAQIAVMFLLVETAALFSLSLRHAANVDTGFAKGAMAFADIAPGAAGLNRAESAAFFETLLNRVRALPNVDAAAYARHVPLNSIYGSGGVEHVRVPGHEPPPGAVGFDVRQNVVSPGYFGAMGTRLVAGRDFGPGDRDGAERAVIVNQTMARRFWGDEDPTGRRIEILGTPGTAEAARPAVIVGVAADEKYNTLKETTPAYMYFAMAQSGSGEMALIARGRGDERVLAGALRSEISAVNRDVPALEILTRTEHFHRALFLERTLAGATTGIGAISLTLALVGIYGVIAFAVVRRRRDIGIEMALGASRARVVRNVIASGARLALTGMGIGGAIGVGTAMMLSSALYDVSAFDPRIFLAAAAITLPLALMASAVPAARASRIDPIQAIRESVQ